MISNRSTSRDRAGAGVRVSRSAYYARVARGRTTCCAGEGIWPTVSMTSGGRIDAGYGVPRVTASLPGEKASRCNEKKSGSDHGRARYRRICGRASCAHPARDSEREPAPDLVERDSRPMSRRVVGGRRDLHSHDEVGLFMASVLDVFSGDCWDGRSLAHAHRAVPRCAPGSRWPPASGPVWRERCSIRTMAASTPANCSAKPAGICEWFSRWEPWAIVTIMLWQRASGHP